MSERVTKANLNAMFEHAVLAATAVGIDTEGWTLQHGSGTNGVPYELSSGLLREHLGASMAEAYGTLSAWRRAWQMVHWALDKQVGTGKPLNTPGRTSTQRVQV